MLQSTFFLEISSRNNGTYIIGPRNKQGNKRMLKKRWYKTPSKYTMRFHFKITYDFCNLYYY